MFRHQGKTRTFVHNLKLASMLSFVAGIVNISGLLAVSLLTTNVTGHFAYFAEQLVVGNYMLAVLFILYILFFLFGALFSGLMIQFMRKIRPSASHALPMSVEIILLLAVGLSRKIDEHGVLNQLIACTLLFSMGLQNALVTSVSRAVVRTTHLTGLFTDLGIELSQLFFHQPTEERKRLYKSIKLHLAIISFFFLGGVLGGFAFEKMGITTILIAAVCLIFALWYDIVLYRIYLFSRKIKKYRN